MLTEEQIAIISETLAPVFNNLEQEVIADISRRIANTMTYSRTAELQAIALQKLGYSPSKIRSESMKMLRADAEFRKIVAKNTIEYKKEVQRSIDRTVLEARMLSDEVIAKSGNMSWISDLSLWKSGGIELTDQSFLSGLVDGIQRQTRADLINLTRSTGFKTISGWESVENAYQKELDKGLIKVMSGAFSQEKVVRDTVHALAKSGLRSIDYASGTTRELSSAVSTAIRTGANQISAEMMNKNIENTGQNLVYVTEHANARNKGVGIANHEEWQGKVYYINPIKDYTEEAKRIGQDKIEDLYEKTGYSLDGIRESNPLGLHGYNCRHQHFAWFEGASSLPERLKPRPTISYNGKTYDGYAQTQEMRKREREIRSLKREADAELKLGQDTTETDKRIKERTREYKAFCNACGVKPSTRKLRYEANVTDIKKTKAYKDFKDAIEPYNGASDVDIDIEQVQIKKLDLSKMAKGDYGNRKADARSITPEDFAEMHEAIEEVNRDYDLKLDQVILLSKPLEMFNNVPLAYMSVPDENYFKHWIIINPYNEFWNNYAIRKKLFEGEYFASVSVKDMMKHELAHALTYRGCKNKFESDILNILINLEHTENAVGYATNENADAIAEAFVKIKRTPQEQALVNKYIERWRKK